MSFDLAIEASLRRLKPERQTRTLARRHDEQLAFADAATTAGGALLLDTTVYIDTLQGRVPPVVEELIHTRTCNHTAVCVAEVCHILGRLHPSHPQRKQTERSVVALLGAMKRHRIIAPAPALWGEAGIIAGLLFRLAHHDRGQETRCLNDALIYLQARQQGLTVLTRNIADFDLIDQIVGGGNMLLYRMV